MQKQRKNPALQALKVLCILIIVPLLALIAYSATSLIGRIHPTNAMPQNFLAYIHIPKPIQSAATIVEDSSIQRIITENGGNTLIPLVAGLRESKALKNPLIRMFANPPIHVALLTDQSFIAVADARFLASWLRLLPSAIETFTIPEISLETHNGHLFYKYQPLESKTTPVPPPPIYVTIKKNLILVSAGKPSVLLSTLNNLELEEKNLISYQFTQTKFDVGILLSPNHIVSQIKDSNPLSANVLSTLDFGEFAEITLSLHENSLESEITIPVTSNDADIHTLLEQKSTVPALYTILPKETQYATILSAGKLQGLVSAVISFGGSDMQKAWQDASTASKSVLGLSLENLLFSWTGEEFAIFGLEGRPQSVFAVQISNSKQQKIIFDKVFSSLVIAEDSSAVIDGLRIPQIKVPPFLARLLSLWNVSTIEPYYIEQDEFIFFSASPETLVATVNAIKKNQLLVKEQTWKTLSEGKASRSSLSIFYSLDRAVPFFLRGNSLVEKTLKLYRTGLSQITLSPGYLHARLNVAASEGAEISTLPGFPLAMGAKINTDIDVVLFQKRRESRLIVVENERLAVSINPLSLERFEFQFSENIWLRSAQNLKPKTAKENSIWILGDKGTVALASGDLEIDQNFPISLGVRVSGSPVVSKEGFLIFIDNENFLHTVDDKAQHTSIELPFNEQLRTAPSLLYTQKETYFALYPRSFFGQLWLVDSTGKAATPWPVPVEGISNTAAIVAENAQGVTVALLTQAGEFSRYSLEGIPITGFPLSIPDVFSIQPIFDGSSFWALSENGTLYEITDDGQIRSQKIEGLSAKNGYIVQADTDGDKQAEIYFSGDANILFGYNSDFTPRNGFPLSAWGKPFFGDVNGDGIIECLSPTMQNTIAAWQLR